MAKEYELEIMGQATWHGGQPRKISMYFSEPEKGADENTGILLLVAGYGGHAGSRVYQKMRNRFADDYNLVTLQCDYLGFRHMQSDHHMPVTEDVIKDSVSEAEYARLLKDFQGNKDEIFKNNLLQGYVELDETEEDYNEMGLLQAMDNLMAVKVLLDVMEENGVVPLKDRMYLYGQSHGAYLAYVCNYLAPGLFAGIIENSAYLLPEYLSCDREVIKEGEEISLRKLYHYQVRDEAMLDGEAYDLTKLYAQTENTAAIISFHGADDTMIPLAEKKEFLSGLSHATLHEISSADVDGDIFKSSGHSLGADLLKVFEMGYRELEEKKPHRDGTVIIPEDKQFATALYEYRVSWETGIPLLERRGRETDKCISIIVPCYNVGKYIDRCVESLVNQTIGIENLELIFVNDASTDDTLDHLTVWEEKYPESILVVDCEENHKQGAARNTGLLYASAPYIGYVDSDDWVEAAMYEKMYEKVEQFGPDAVCVLSTRDEQDGTVRMRSNEKKNGDKFVEIKDEAARRKFFGEGLTGGVWSGIYRKDLLLEENIMFPEDLRYEDNYWSAILNLVIRSYYIINEHLYHYMINEASTIMEKDSMHHLDRLVTELMKIEEYKRRGVFDLYHDEIEFSFLRMYFINTIRILFVRFTKIPYDIIYTMQDNVKELFPDYEKNPKLNKLPQLQRELLKIASVPLDEEKINILAQAYRKVLLENQ